MPAARSRVGVVSEPKALRPAASRLALLFPAVLLVAAVARVDAGPQSPGQHESPPTRRWFAGASIGAATGAWVPGLLHKGDHIGNLALNDVGTRMTEVEAGCQFRPTLAVVAIINIKGIDAGTDDFGFLTDNPIPGIQVATGDVVGYGVEIRKQALTDYRGYFFSPASTDKFRFWFGAGIFEQRAVHLSAAPPGQTYIGVTSVRGGTQDYLRLSLGVDVKIRRTGLVVQAGVAGMLHLSGWLLEVQTGTASQFEGSGVVGSGAAQAIAGMAYHF